MSVFKKLAPIFALAAVMAVAAPEIAHAQNYPYPNSVPVPTGGIPVGPSNPAGPYDSYFGPPMTQEAIDEALTYQPRAFNYIGKGYTDAQFPDGERVGILYELDNYGHAYNGMAYDLNNPAQLNQWNGMMNTYGALDSQRRAMYEYQVRDGLWRGEPVYTGIYNPCRRGPGGFEVIVGGGRAGIIIGGPYIWGPRRPIIVEPIYRSGWPRRGGVWDERYPGGVWNERYPGGVYGRPRVDIDIRIPFGGRREEPRREIFNGGGVWQRGGVRERHEEHGGSFRQPAVPPRVAAPAPLPHVDPHAGQGGGGQHHRHG